MIRHLKYIIIGFVLFANSINCQSNLDEIENIKSILYRQQDAWNRGDIKGYMQEYWKSDSLLFTSSGNIQRGWKETLDKYERSYSTQEKMGKLYFSELEISILSKESALVFGHWELKRKQDNPKGVFTLILRNFKDGWKIIHDHTSIQSDEVKTK